MATPKSLQETRKTARNSVRKKDTIGTERDIDQEGTLHETLEYRESAIRENNGKRLSLSLAVSLFLCVSATGRFSSTNPTSHLDNEFRQSFTFGHLLGSFHPWTSTSYLDYDFRRTHLHSVISQEFFIHESPPHILFRSEFQKNHLHSVVPRFFHPWTPNSYLDNEFRKIIGIQLLTMIFHPWSATSHVYNEQV
jgi:hypothetical protein